MPIDITDVPPDKLQAVLANLEAEKQRRITENALGHYRPYPQQAKFHAAGATHRERLLMTCNRFGKTVGGAAEFAYHLTGLYPDDWIGKRFDKPIRAWAAGVTGETTRDVVQAKLIGPPFREAEWGTGMIPKATMGSVAMSRGVPAAIDTVSVKHVAGGYSSVQFKSYERGREKWQGAALEVVWFDEEPDIDIYVEGLTRTNETGGISYMTMTPLLGQSDVVSRFVTDPSPDRIVINATIDDAPHFTGEDIARITASYLPHEREARLRGVPTLGSGKAFHVLEETLMVDPFKCPSHWTRGAGLDFGWSHYFAAVELWHDRDLDIVYLARTLRMKEKTPLEHVEALRHWNLRFFWPHDGRNRTLAGAGVSLADQYKGAGLDTWHEAATFPDGSNSLEAGVALMHDRMKGGRWKVFRGENEGWLEEYRLYHRDKDGLLVAKNDDAMSASRYGLMMLRNFRTNGAHTAFNRRIEYPAHFVA